MNVTVLVDFENDSVRTALEVAEALGDKLWGVRLDTSGQLVDQALWHEMGNFPPTGVNPVLVERVRQALDGAGYERVKIVASGGFDAARIRRVRGAGHPVDSYGVGSALLRGENDFTADVVRVDGRDCAKVGRRFNPNPRLEPVGSGLDSAPVFGRIDHVAMAVEDLDDAIALYRGRLGMPLQHRETSTSSGSRLCCSASATLTWSC